MSHFRRMNNYIKKPTYGPHQYCSCGDSPPQDQMEEHRKIAAMLPNIKPKNDPLLFLSARHTYSHGVLMSGLAFGQH